MADTYQYIDSTGVILADVSDIKAEVQEEWKAAIGQDLILSDNTPQGQLIDGETLQRSNTIKAIAQVANQFDPSQSGGVWLDAMCAWLYIEREPETATRIYNCVLGGKSGTVIPAGSRATTADGDEVMTTEQVRIDSTGTATVDCVCVESGPISVPAGSLSRPKDSILGWETIQNPTAGATGQLEQSDASLRQSRYERLARNNISCVEAIISSLYDIKEVHSVSFRENISDQTMTIDGVTLKPHSIWACVYGGSSADVAAVLLREKTEGAGYNGSQSVSVVEKNSGQTYDVRFERAQEVPIKVRVTARPYQSSLELIPTIKDAILKYASGQIDGEKGFAAGNDVSPFELSGAINIVSPGIFVRKVEVMRAATGSFSSSELPIALWEIPTVQESNITVVVEA